MSQRLTPDQTAQQWADTLAARHEEFYAEAPKAELQQMIVMLYPDGGIDMLLCPWEDAEQREITLTVLRAAVKELKVVRYAFFAEVWMSMSVGKKPPSLRPSQDPNRVEKVFTLVCDRRLPEPVAVLQQIERGRNGGVRRLVREPQLADVHMAGGALANLFDDEGVTVQ
jgi:hypothetical protein